MATTIFYLENRKRAVQTIKHRVCSVACYLNSGKIVALTRSNFSQKLPFEHIDPAISVNDTTEYVSEIGLIELIELCRDDPGVHLFMPWP